MALQLSGDGGKMRIGQLKKMTAGSGVSPRTHLFILSENCEIRNKRGDLAVEVFEIRGHPQADKCYAWSPPIEGSTKRRYFAVLHVPR
jgi:hypothetical protein